MINIEYDKKISAWIEAHREQIMQRWMDLIRIPSVHGEAAPNAPFGVECAQALKKAASYFEEEGFATRVEEARGYALAEYGDGPKTIGLFGHSDVVPVGDGWVFTNPFEPVVVDGTLIGRGANDNKNGIVATLCLMSILRDCGIKLNNRLLVYIGSNEEDGMGDIEAFVEHEKMPDLSLVPDSIFPCGIGEKGILRMWAEAQEPLCKIENFAGGDAFNVILDRVTVTLQYDAALEAQIAALIDGDPNFTLAKEDGKLVLGAVGVAKHASRPEGSVNAGCLAAAVLAQCEALPQGDRTAMQTVVDLLGFPFGEGLGIKHVDSRFGSLTAANGMVAVENGKLRVSLDVRYGTEVEPKGLEEALAKAWNSRGWEIVYMYNRAGFYTDESSPVPGIIMDVCREMAGSEPKPYYSSGGTYARYLNNAFAVGTAIHPKGRTKPYIKFPAGHGDAHQRDEGLDIDNYFLGLRMLAQILFACDEALV